MEKEAEVVEEVKENETEKEVEAVEENKKPETLQEKDVVEEAITEPIVEKEIKYGKLTKCKLLNVRKEPIANSEILFTVSDNDTIEIIDEIDEFYKVKVNDKEGYCVKYFIEIK